METSGVTDVLRSDEWDGGRIQLLHSKAALLMPFDVQRNDIERNRRITCGDAPLLLVQVHGHATIVAHVSTVHPDTYLLTTGNERRNRCDVDLAGTHPRQ